MKLLDPMDILPDTEIESAILGRVRNVIEGIDSGVSLPWALLKVLSLVQRSRRRLPLFHFVKYAMKNTVYNRPEDPKGPKGYEKYKGVYLRFLAHLYGAKQISSQERRELIEVLFDVFEDFRTVSRHRNRREEDGFWSHDYRTPIVVPG